MTDSTTTPYAFNKDTIPYSALLQEEFWYDKKGNLHRISEMNPKHAYYALKKLFGAHGSLSINTPLGKALKKAQYK